MKTRAADERAHEPGGAPGWSEVWHLDAVTGDGVGLAVRLARWPARGRAWWWTYLVRPDRAGPVVVRDHDVPPPRVGLEVRADGLWGELACETPFEHWTVSLEAFGVALDDPADALRGERGERLPVGLDLEWEVDARMPEARARSGIDGMHGYVQLGTVRGELLLGTGRFELDAVGMRSHSWGEQRFDGPVSEVWLAAPDLFVSFVAVGDDRADGFVARPGEPDAPIHAVRTELRRAAGLPVAARHVVDGAWEIEVDVSGTTPIPVTGVPGEPARLTRARCRGEVTGLPGDDEAGAGRVGNGWSAWLDPG